MKFTWWNKVQIHEMPLKVLCHPWNTTHSQFDFIYPNSMDENLWNMVCEFVLDQ